MIVKFYVDTCTFRTLKALLKKGSRYKILEQVWSPLKYLASVAKVNKEAFRFLWTYLEVYYEVASSILDIISWYQFLCMSSHCGYFYHAQRSMTESCYQKVSENLSWVTIWWKTIAVLVKALPGLKLKNSSEWAPGKLYFLGLFMIERKTGILDQRMAVATAAKPKLWTEKLDTLLGLPFWRNSCFVSNVRLRAYGKCGSAVTIAVPAVLKSIIEHCQKHQKPKTIMKAFKPLYEQLRCRL